MLRILVAAVSRATVSRIGNRGRTGQEGECVHSLHRLRLQGRPRRR